MPGEVLAFCFYIISTKEAFYMQINYAEELEALKRIETNLKLLMFLEEKLGCKIDHSQNVYDIKKILVENGYGKLAEAIETILFFNKDEM
jgi:hypothetical protein